MIPVQVQVQVLVLYSKKRPSSATLFFILEPETLDGDFNQCENVCYTVNLPTNKHLSSCIKLLANNKIAENLSKIVRSVP